MRTEWSEVFVEVCSDTAACVAAGSLVENALACLGVAQVVSVRFLFVYHEYFQSGAVGQEVAQVQGVAVSEAGAVEQRAVVVEGG